MALITENNDNINADYNIRYVLILPPPHRK